MRLAIESLHTEFHFRWEGFTPDPGNVTRIWNGLARLALEDQYDYFMVGGDDIVYPHDKEWLQKFIYDLQANQNIGWISGFSNHPCIATQFFLHRTHMEMLGWVFPPQIRNWYCDDFLNEVYPEKYRVWHKHVQMLNSGGPERYRPNKEHRTLCDQLVARYREPLARAIAAHVAAEKSLREST